MYIVSVLVTTFDTESKLLGAFTKLRKATISFVLSVCLSPLGIVRLPLDRFSWNLVFENFSKICRGNFEFH